MLFRTTKSLAPLLRRYSAILVATVALLAMGAISLKLWQHSLACTPSFDETYTYFPAAGAPANFRVYLIPGIHQSAANFLSAPLAKSWAEGLTALGADVAVLNTPIPIPCWFSDDGTAYRAAFLHGLDTVMRDADGQHGVPRRAIVSGVSLGGLHAMVAFASRPERFSGWQTLITVTHLGVLGELDGIGPVPKFDAFSEIDRLRGSTGFMAWGGADLRVDYHLDEALFAAIKSPTILGVEYWGLRHDMTREAIENLLADAKRQSRQLDPLGTSERNAPLSVTTTGPVSASRSLGN